MEKWQTPGPPSHNVCNAIVRSDGRLAAVSSTVAPTLLRAVLELRSRLQRLLGGSRQNDLAHLLLQLGHRHSDVMLVHAQEPADADDSIRDRSVGRHDEVVDVTDLLS